MKANRRRFISGALGSTAVLSLGGRAPQFLLEAAERDRGKRETVLVVVQLSGGNDGLNTVVPYNDDGYRANRPTLAVGADQVLKINDELGFHPEAEGLSKLLEDDQLSIVQGVGYANPNRSHFESMDIWHTCDRKQDRRKDGWLGRFLDQTHGEAGRDVPALHLGDQKQPFALAGQVVRSPSVKSIERFRLQGDNESLKKAIKQLAESPRKEQANDLLGFVQSSAASALAASERVEAASKGYDSPVEYPSTNLARRLRTVAQLVDAGLNTRVYYVELDGFDTHSRQAAAHAALLGELAGAVHAFIKDCAHHGHADRVVTLCFSEFGRRVKENASEGTDHGAAAPLFLAGKPVKSGLVGKLPSLTDLQQGDLKHHTDFRRVYATVLKDWLGFEDPTSILGGKFAPLKIFA